MHIPRVARFAPLCLILLAGCAEMTEVRSVWEVNGEALDQADRPPYDAGKAHLARGHLGLAVTAFQRAVAQQPQSLEALNALAATYDKMGRYDLADRNYARALALSPDDPQTLNNAGYSRFLRGDFREAMRLFTAAGTRAPDDPVVAGNLAAVQRALAAAAQPQGTPAPTIANLPKPVRPRMVVERSGPGVHSLTMAAPEFLAAARKVGVDPKLALVGPDQPPARKPLQEDPPQAVAAPRPAPTLERPSCRLEVSNGVGRARMAKRMRGYLKESGVDVGCLSNAEAFSAERTVIYHRPGFAARALEIAALLPVAAVVEAAPDQRNDIRLLIGRDLIPLDQELVDKEHSHEA
ncbi:MAG: LytR C-terminal domain-containing protein [Rhodospirillales bacterium]|nr:LytR C-terminal domain-containing protein [Rhodospirillales bacterium]